MFTGIELTSQRVYEVTSELPGRPALRRTFFPSGWCFSTLCGVFLPCDYWLDF